MAIKNFKVLYSVAHGEPFGGVECLKVEIGTGCVICMENDLMSVDEKNGMYLSDYFKLLSNNCFALLQ